MDDQGPQTFFLFKGNCSHSVSFRVEHRTQASNVVDETNDLLCLQMPRTKTTKNPHKTGMAFKNAQRIEVFQIET